MKTLGCLLLFLSVCSYSFAWDDNADFKFRGVVQDMTATEWTVDARTVLVDGSTKLEEDHGSFQVGSCVEVKGSLLADNSVLASKIETEEPGKCGAVSGPSGSTRFEFTGPLEAMPSGGSSGVWTIGGEAVTVVNSTRLQTEHGPFVIGACLEVEGMQSGDGAREANKIQTEEPGKCGLAQPPGQPDQSQPDVGQPDQSPPDQSQPDQGQPELGKVKFDGFIQQMPPAGFLGNWIIEGKTVIVNAVTKLGTDYGQFSLNACVEVKGIPLGGGDIQAVELETQRPGKCDPGRGAPEMAFYGTVRTLPSGDGLAGDWTVDGTTVHVLDTAKIEQEHGPVSVGSCVEVKGFVRPDGSIDAEKIEVGSASGGCSADDKPSDSDDVAFYGFVQGLPDSGTLFGDWRVGTRTVAVDNSTKLDFDGAPVTLGQCVEVEGRMLDDASILAQDIDRESSGAKCGGAGNETKIEFFGLIEQLPAGSTGTSGLTGAWQVGGRSVDVSVVTMLEPENGPFQVGACAKVEGDLLAAGAIDSREIKTEPGSACEAGGSSGVFKFEGIVASAPASGGPNGVWAIGNRQVSVGGATVIDEKDGLFQIGACVEVHGQLSSNLDVDASKIEVESASGSCLSFDGARHAATLGEGSVSPGQILSLFGLGIGPADPATASAEGGVVDSSLANTRVLFDGVPAPVLYASKSQINVVVPNSVKGREETNVQVEYAGAWTNVLTLSVAPVSPGLFTLTGTGRGQAAALNFDDGAYTVNGSASPVERGDVIILYATGAGSNAAVDGQVIVQATPLKGVDVTVTIGGRQATLLYAGAAPGLVSGIVQLNVRVPEDAPRGSAVAIGLEMDGVASPDGVTIAIR